MLSTHVYRVLTAVLICLFISSELHAQNARDANSGVAFRVLTFDRVKGLKEIDLIDEEKGKNSLPIKMHKNNYTGPYKSAGRTLRFYKPTDQDDEVRVPVGMIKVPNSLGRKVLLIAVPTKKQTYHFFPIADDFSNFRAGEMKLINLTSVSIAAKLNGKPFAAGPLKVTHIGKLSSKHEPHSYPVEFYFKDEDKWSPVSSSYWQHEPDVRNLAFCYRDTKTGRIRIRTIRELPSARSKTN